MDEHRPGPDANEPAERYKAPETPPAPREELPHWSLWLPYLAFRPGLFFETFVLRPVPVLTVLTAWLYGTASAIDRIESRVLLSRRPNELYEMLREDWGVYWAISAVVGVLSGALYYGIGGWWYRVRLKWSGAADPDRCLSRRVYVYAAQAYVVPFLLYTVWETFTYSSPAVAAGGDDFGGVVVLAALFWSVYVSYRGVRTAFNVRTWPARVWFGLLPVALYSLVILGVMGAMLVGDLGDRLEGPPDVGNAARIEREGFTLDYPGNWEIDTLDEDYDPDHEFSIGPVFADATLRFWFYLEAMGSQACVDQTVANLDEVYDLTDPNPFDRWGRFEGAGYRSRASIEDKPYVFVMFCSTESERPFEFLLVSEEPALEKLAPGFDLIRDTLELRPLEAQPM